ncbi:unnamed protein product [Acanthocheilonema viteae]|uniref:Uncharacterized protein n=1 Tax=Acanthocheilonema viteae TaxID=6277 RepID=A0A498SL36_ACAVI|nr:unnamed protein product [Acanthocheilonema viteae]
MGGADLQKRLVKRIREVSPRQRKQQYTQCSDMMNVVSSPPSSSSLSSRAFLSLYRFIKFVAATAASRWRLTQATAVAK